MRYDLEALSRVPARIDLGSLAARACALVPGVRALVSEGKLKADGEGFTLDWTPRGAHLSAGFNTLLALPGAREALAPALARLAHDPSTTVRRLAARASIESSENPRKGS